MTRVLPIAALFLFLLPGHAYAHGGEIILFIAAIICIGLLLLLGGVWLMLKLSASLMIGEEQDIKAGTRCGLAVFAGGLIYLYYLFENSYLNHFNDIIIACALLVVPVVPIAAICNRIYYRIRISRLRSRHEKDAWKTGEASAQRQYEMGENYLRGSATFPKDYAMAELWYKKAADQGHGPAQYGLGILMEEKQDADGAMEWYRKAAKQNIKNAQFSLAQLLMKRKNYEEAYYWYLLSGRNFPPLRIEVEGFLTPAKAEEIREKAEAAKPA